MTPAKVPRGPTILRQAIAEGHEIGTHVNGHFCGKGVGDVDAAQWTDELNAFDQMVRTGPATGGRQDARSAVRPSHGEGHADSVPGGQQSGVPAGDESPRHAVRRVRPWVLGGRRRIDGLWDFPLQSRDARGDQQETLTMDYNLWYAQTKARKAPVAQAPQLQGTGAGDVPAGAGAVPREGQPAAVPRQPLQPLEQQRLLATRSRRSSRRPASSRMSGVSATSSWSAGWPSTGVPSGRRS